MKRVAIQSAPEGAGKAENAAEAADVGSHEATISSEHLMSASPKDKGVAVWKWTRKHGDKLAPPSLSPAPSVVNIPSLQLVTKPQWVESFRLSETYIGKSIVIRGDVSGGGNVYWDGELKGSVDLLDGAFAVGPEGCVRANVQAPSIVVLGRVDGNLHSFERAELKKSAIVVGDIHTPRIAIEDGASVEGKVRVHQDLSRRTKISSINEKLCG